MVLPYIKYTAGRKKVDEDDIDNWIDSEIVRVFTQSLNTMNRSYIANSRERDVALLLGVFPAFFSSYGDVCQSI